jgi:putative serine protease PepD
VASVAAALLPRVVSISVKADSGSGTGSGFVIRSDGFILTNNHVIRSVIEGGGVVRVTFNDEREVGATIVGHDASYDLAVLKVDAVNLPAVEWADSNAVAVGDPVIAIGSPLGLSGTVTTGIISAKERPVTAGAESGGDEQSYINAIQTDAAINPGNSGGPLVDARGRVVGVNSAIAQLSQSSAQQSGSIGVGFAIPSAQAKRTAEALIRTGKATHPIIGVLVDPAFTGSGARIREVSPGGPAVAAALKAGDVITAIDGHKVHSAEELIVQIRAREPDQVVTLDYTRGGKAAKASLTLRAAP